MFAINNSSEGFTLVEVLVSIVLIGIISVAVFPMFSNAIRIVFSSDSKTNYINVARKELLSELSSTDSTISEEVDLKIDDKDDGSTVITSKKYTIEKSYKLPDKGNKTLMIEYYKYPD